MSSRTCASCGSKVPEVEAACLACGTENAVERPKGRPLWPPGSLAPNGKRAVNCVLDTLLILGSVDLLRRMGETLMTSLGYDWGPYRLIWPALLAVPCFFLYYAGFEACFGRTPAKFLTRTRVVMEDGSHPPLSTILWRTCNRFGRRGRDPVLGSQDSVHRHDSRSRTRVVNG